ncbi:phosphoribosyltransferase [Micromonospora sp. NBC_01813]|uniref:phosphoribosyltransferase n=1 Tax=Micromonospora sp. NBC_01813 TaxID=2975988 RepID=UPI002DDB085F|nr:phosphoribosyltransferase family protein [Micromonospora sp. NBC_01813]WSA07043.1 phosphoribosyltransferase domain-containing protein [Micromonospora sp. NBC_01813]
MTAHLATPRVPSRRIFEGQRIWHMSTDLLTAATSLLAGAEQPFAPDVIIGIARGGVPVASALSQLMRVPDQVITARHNLDDRIMVQATGRVTIDTAGLPRERAGQRILLVDDICGTGATIDAVRAALDAQLRPAAVRTVVLCRNSGSPVMPDTWVWDVADWTVFPWETDPGQVTESLPVPAGVRHP